MRLLRVARRADAPKVSARRIRLSCRISRPACGGQGACGSTRVARVLRRTGAQSERSRDEAPCANRTRWPAEEAFQETTDSNHPDPIAPCVLERNVTAELLKHGLGDRRDLRSDATRMALPGSDSRSRLASRGRSRGVVRAGRARARLCCCAPSAAQLGDPLGPVATRASLTACLDSSSARRRGGSTSARRSRPRCRGDHDSATARSEPGCSAGVSD